MDGHVLGQQGHSGSTPAEQGYTGVLPAELLVDIFSLLPFWDRVRTAIVCRRWRAVSLEAAGRLWSTLVAPGKAVAPRDVDACRGLLERARPTLVSFTIPDMFDENFKALGEMIVEHLPHIKALDITFLEHPFISWAVVSDLSHGVSATLQADAPVLERIRIADRAKVMIKGMSILEAPALNHIELRGLDLCCLRKCAGSRALRTLIVDTHGMRWDRVFPFDWTLICSFPLLENLAVCIESAEIPDVSANRRPFPRTLKRVSLSLRPTTFAQLTTPRDFARLEAWQLVFLNVASQQLADLADLMPYLQHIGPAAAGAVEFDSNAFHVTLTASDGRHATVHGLRFDAAWSFPLASVARLCIGGLGTLPAAAMRSSASLAALEDLILDVTPESSAFASTTFKWPRLACPGLRALCLRSAAATRKIPLAAIEDLLQDSLAVGHGKLAELVLHGVQVLVPQGVDAVVVLNELADTVTILEADGVWPECYLAWNRPWDELVR